MSSSSARQIFKSAIQAVQPNQLVAANLRRSENTIHFGSHQHKLNNNVYVVGFGKAVGGMCHAIQNIVGDHIVNGVLSLPSQLSNDLTAQKLQSLLPLNDGRVIVFEGAKNNLPDEKSLFAAQKIIEICQNATKNDLVIALVSGGGSALLPAPVNSLSLHEKVSAISLLTSKGATIQEINTFRKNLSTVKGGQLAHLTSPAQMWSFILSDIIGDPIELIASGPTVPSQKNPEAAALIIEQYGLQEKLAPVLSILKTISAEKSLNNNAARSNVVNSIVGSNKIAIEAAVNAAKNLGYDAIVLSRAFQGEAKLLGAAFAQLSQHFARGFTLENNLEVLLKDIFQRHGMNQSDINRVCLEITAGRGDKIRFCIISGGETTVSLTSKHGIGGRNQEMVLSFALKLNDLQRSLTSVNDDISITFLSGGTDGQDGPTAAAGAVFCSTQLTDFNRLLASQSLEQHDSNTFFKKSNNLVMTGLTGTNVMDIQVLLIESIK